MFSRRNIILIFSLLLVMVSGCSTVTNYNPAHIPDTQISSTKKITGKALIYTEKEDDAYIYTGSPTSLTGSGTTLSMELGNMTKQIARKVFSEYFTEGATTSNSYDSENTYTLIVKPKVSSFTYEYNQLKNLGFAITPQLQMNLNVCLLKSDGTIYFEKDYASEIISGGSYMIALESPGEKINRAAHITLHELMVKAAEETTEAIRTKANDM